MLEKLKIEVCRANQDLDRLGLVTCTWGNVSGIDRSSGCVVIKPSGVEYDSLTPENMSVVNLEGNIVEGLLQPSSDTPTHLVLYRAFLRIGGIVHTHSTYATMFAQANREIPCMGTTHADNFNGPIRITRFLTKREANEGYEAQTGNIIAECLSDADPLQTPAVLVVGHGPFAWGKDPQDAVQNSLVLERVAQIAIGSFILNPTMNALPQHIQKVHFLRKHGPNAYYGQKNQKQS
jgi:L-ribulose-5-phosphate 4-epimerase